MMIVVVVVAGVVDVVAVSAHCRAAVSCAISTMV